MVQFLGSIIVKGQPSIQERQLFFDLGFVSINKGYSHLVGVIPTKVARISL
jgi:hypothetical protein